MADLIKSSMSFDYYPDMEADSEVLETIFGLTPDMYDDYFCEIPAISVLSDTLLIVKPADGKRTPFYLLYRVIWIMSRMRPCSIRSMPFRQRHQQSMMQVVTFIIWHSSAMSALPNRMMLSYYPSARTV